MRFPIDLLRHHKPVEHGSRTWCVDRDLPDGVVCVDGLIGTGYPRWPDEAVICVDQLTPGHCVTLGDLRHWVERYQTRVYARHAG